MACAVEIVDFTTLLASHPAKIILPFIQPHAEVACDDHIIMTRLFGELDALQHMTITVELFVVGVVRCPGRVFRVVDLSVLVSGYDMACDQPKPRLSSAGRRGTSTCLLYTSPSPRD